MGERIRKMDILNIVTSMKKACETLLKNNVSEADSISILTECQNAAIEIGNYIESTYEEQTDIVEILEMFCECIYQSSLVYEEKELYQRQLKIAGKQLIDLYNKVNLNLPKDKKEIVFFPYKASMWDSLESVWRAASKDEECDTYVVPIPYYDKKADGSFGEMHYEGNEYPEYVPITSWKEYSVSERRPDVIYIHNPYDDNNYVTSVHPEFYSNKLREYTNMLVYIPYFVAINDKVNPKLCMSPAVLFAHKVIVQSESVRKTYIEEFHKFEKENNCKNVFGIAEEKIVALGSPKYDKVINSKIEDFDIPAEWEKLLFKGNGTRKKVVLYNTTIDAMLTQEGMLNKIADVLKSFKDEKEAVLLWRPHPLLKSTLKAMRPEFVQEYEEIENKYKKEGYGIYDDSSELYRAIVLSDFYYGDSSSVVELYKFTAKPVIIQRADRESISDCCKNDYIANWIKYGKCVYGITSFNKYIVGVDVEKGNQQFINKIQGAEIKPTERFLTIIAYNEWLYFIPINHNKMIAYNTQTAEQRVVLLPLENMESDRILECNIRDDEIIFFMKKQGRIWGYNWETEKIREIQTFSEEINWGTGVVLEDGRIAVPFSDKVLLLNLKTGDFIIHNIGRNEEEFSRILLHKEKLWIVVKNKAVIIQWDYKENNSRRIVTLPQKDDGEKVLFGRYTICQENEVVYCFSKFGNYLIKIDMDKFSVESIVLNNPNVVELRDIIHNDHKIYALNAKEILTYFDEKDGFEKRSVKYNFSEDAKSRRNLLYSIANSRIRDERKGQEGDSGKNIWLYTKGASD